MITKLLVCPFCGCDATFFQGKTPDGEPYVDVGCWEERCNVQPNLRRSSTEAAIKAWNQRAGSSKRTVGLVLLAVADATSPSTPKDVTKKLSAALVSSYHFIPVEVSVLDLYEKGTAYGWITENHDGLISINRSKIETFMLTGQ